MKVFLVCYHPEKASFNHAMFEKAQEAFARRGDQVRTSDLAAMKFNPVAGREAYLTEKDPDVFKQQLEELNATEHDSFAPFIAEEQEKILWCDLMILQFPLWWFGMPAVLKGWVDRVYAMGKLYRGDMLYSTGVKKNAKALLSITTGAPREAYLPGGMNGDIHGILRPIHRGRLEFLGFEVLAPQIVYAPAHLSAEDRKRALEQYANRLQSIEKEKKWIVGDL
ncbi:MAG: NAD(P)H-dependent oxidoreductase [Victivallaceae bacterium]|nr:NAD(P)H-dependent oxidoreductase [Victivallaceae bacterium]